MYKILFLLIIINFGSFTNRDNSTEDLNKNNIYQTFENEQENEKEPQSKNNEIQNEISVIKIENEETGNA